MGMNFMFKISELKTKVIQRDNYNKALLFLGVKSKKDLKENQYINLLENGAPLSIKSIPKNKRIYVLDNDIFLVIDNKYPDKIGYIGSDSLKIVKREGYKQKVAYKEQVIKVGKDKVISFLKDTLDNSIERIENSGEISDNDFLFIKDIPTEIRKINKKELQSFGVIGDDFVAYSDLYDVVIKGKAKGIKEFFVNVKGKKLNDYLKFEFNNNEIYLIDKTNKKILLEKDLVKTKKFNSQEIIKVDNNIKTLFKIADKNNHRYELNGLLLDTEKDNIVATDTKRLSVMPYKFNIKINNEIQPIIPKIPYLILKTNEIKLDYQNEKVRYYDKNNDYVESNFIKGIYPHYNRIIPDNISNYDNLNGKFSIILNNKTFKEKEVFQIIEFRFKDKNTFECFAPLKEDGEEFIKLCDYILDKEYNGKIRTFKFDYSLLKYYIENNSLKLYGKEDVPAFYVFNEDIKSAIMSIRD